MPKEITSIQAKTALFERAQLLGFEAIGICAPDAIPDAAERLRAFVAKGYHGDMDWLADSDKIERRAHPNILWPDARSVIMLGMNYGPNDNPLARLSHTDRGAISCYAQGADYHDVIKSRLKTLARWMADEWSVAVKVFVDTAPLMEKPLAQAAGLGWQGKHTNLVSRDHGSWLFLGAILTDLPLPRQQTELDHCGSCRACLDICPTGAFPAPYQLDARRCISYLTIEHKGIIGREFRAAMGNRIYGCDDCLAVCPWNKFAQTARASAFWPRPELTFPRLLDLAALDDTSFRSLFARSPIKRIGRDRFIRNVAIALGNSKMRAAQPALMHLINDSAPIVRAMAAWALGRLMPREDWMALAESHLGQEYDESVRAEWLTPSDEREA